MEEHDCKCGCLAMSKLRELTKASPPRPGLVPQSGDPEHPGRWVKPEDAEESPIVEVAPIARKPFADIGTKEGLAQRLSTYFGESASKYLRMPRSELQSVFDDVVRRDRQGMITAVEQRVPAGQYRTGGKMMKTQVIQGLEKLIKVGPPRPGLVPQSGDPEHPGRWVRPEDAGTPAGEVGSGEAFTPKNPITVRGKPVQAVKPDGAWEAQVVLDINDFRGPIRDAIQGAGAGEGPFIRQDGDTLEIYFTHNTETAAQGTIDRLGAALKGGGDKTMKTHVTQKLGTLVKGLELQGLTVGLSGLIAKGAACPPDAVPLEQLKGDLARAGHPVKRAIALDAENRRLFFIDNTDTCLFG